MGDTFFSHVDLPSDELIRTQTRLFRFTRRSPTSPSHGHKTRLGLGLGTMVASASENFSIMGGRKRKNVKGGEKRQRSHTVGAADAPRTVISPPSVPEVPSLDEMVSQSPRAGEGSKAWSTLKRMLSKPHLSGGSPGSVGSGSGTSG